MEAFNFIKSKTMNLERGQTWRHVCRRTIP